MRLLFNFFKKDNTKNLFDIDCISFEDKAYDGRVKSCIKDIKLNISSQDRSKELEKKLNDIFNRGKKTTVKNFTPQDNLTVEDILKELQEIE